jgi:hypothetical protein
MKFWIPNFLVAVTSALIGCAGPQKTMPFEQRADSEKKAIVVSSFTTPVEIAVKLRAGTNDSVWREIKIDKKLGVHACSSSRAEMFDLPFVLSLQQKTPELWVIGFSSNLLNLLGSERTNTVYSGRLIFEEEGKDFSLRREIPLKLVFARDSGKGTSGRKKVKIRSAG